VVNGAKVWTSNAHFSHYGIVLVRTSPADPANRHAGLSQLLVAGRNGVPRESCGGDSDGDGAVSRHRRDCSRTTRSVPERRRQPERDN